MPAFESELVPNEAQLFYRVHVNLTVVSGGALRPACFRDNVGMSTDWDKYSTAEATRARGDSGPSKYGIVRLTVYRVRAIEALLVAHTPQEQNQAHTDVFGLSTAAQLLTKQRLELYEACERRWLIAPGDAVAV